MIIKSYTAPTVAAALKKIREEMGGDAVVLNTKVTAEGEIELPEGRVEVTACIDDKIADFRKLKCNFDVDKISSVESKDDLTSGMTGPEKVNIESDSALNRIDKTLNHILTAHRYSGVFGKIDESVRPVLLNLLDADLPEEIAVRIHRNITGAGSIAENAEQIAYDRLRSELKPLCTQSIRIQPGMKIAFVGPSGSGKSSVMARLAAQITIQSGLKVRLTSLENINSKKNDNNEIEIFASPLSNEIKSHISTDDGSVLLIDTPPIMPGEPNSDLLKKLNTISPNMLFFVFSICSRTCDLIDAVNTYESFTPTYLIATHLDETGRWGGIMAMAEYLNRPVAFVTNTPGKIGRLFTADPDVIARRLLKIEGGE